MQIKLEIVSLHSDFGKSVQLKIKIVDTLSYKTVSVNKEKAEKKWYIVDATDKHVGRLASTVAKVIRGKYKPSYTPHADCGDNIIVINAEKISFSGNKVADKIYTRYTGYPGGQRFTTVNELLKKHPERIIEKAVRGMLPKNALGRALYRNLRVYAGTEHNHEAQNPEILNLDSLK